MARSEAQKKADYLASPEFQQNMEHKTIFINRTYSGSDNPKRRRCSRRKRWALIGTATKGAEHNPSQIYPSYLKLHLC